MSNFGSELSKYLPFIVRNIGIGAANAKSRQRRGMIAEAMSPPPEPVWQEQTTLGPGSGQMTPVDPSETEQMAIAQQVRQPAVRNAMMDEGYEPTDLLTLYKSLPVNIRPDFQKVFEENKRAYIMDGPDAVVPQLKPWIEKELGINQPFDPTRVGSVAEARVQAGFGNITPEQLQKIEAAQPPAEKKSRERIRTLADAFDLYKRREITPQEYEEYKTFFKEQTPPGGGKPALPTGQAINEVQEKAERKAAGLQRDLDAWQKADEGGQLTAEQKAQYAQARPEYERQIAEIRGYLQDFEAQKRSADSLQAILSVDESAAQPDSTQTDTITPEEAAQRLQEMGYPDADPNDPEVVQDYLFLLRSQGAPNR